MKWPKELIDSFDKALQDIALTANYTKHDAICSMLDSIACRAVWRAKKNPSKLMDAYFTPYTPLGAITASGMDGVFEHFSIAGDSWGLALNVLREFVQKNADIIIKEYRDKPVPYDDMTGGL